MRYEIDKDNAVLVFFNEEQELPGLYQPNDPAGDGAPFTKVAAEKWAKEFIAEIEMSEIVVEESDPTSEPIVEEPIVEDLAP